MSEELTALFLYRRKPVWESKTGLYEIPCVVTGDGNQQYVWQVSTQEGEPDRILGYRLFTSPFVPVVAASAYTVAFGDFQQYWIADRAGRTVQRLNELYAGNGLVGYLATERVDGKIILTEGIQLLQQA